MPNEFCLCPLYPFDSDCKDLNLICGIHIKPAPDTFQQLLSDPHLAGNTFWDDPSKAAAAWIAEIPFLDRTINEVLKDGQNQEFEVAEMLGDMFAIKTERIAYCFVTALRLFREGLVTPGPIAIPSSAGDKPIWMSPDWLNIASDDYCFDEPAKYVLTQEDIPEINNIFVSVLKWVFDTKHSFIGVALNRFHSAYSGEAEEKIIDQMIAFEALYLGDMQELKYKLAMRTAFFIGESKERKDIYTDMLDAYKLRSNIVHGSDKVKIESIKAILPKTENYLRRSIRKMLLLLSDIPKSEENRQKWLDDMILG